MAFVTGSQKKERLTDPEVDSGESENRWTPAGLLETSKQYFC